MRKTSDVFFLAVEHRRLSAHGGLITYIHDDFAYKELNSELPITSTSTLFESLFLEVWQKRFAKQNILLVMYIVYHRIYLMM